MRDWRNREYRAASRFLAWCDQEHLELPQVSPDLTGRILDEMPDSTSDHYPMRPRKTMPCQPGRI